jgi:membrane-bound lytic murein transglycosylase MltF
MKADGAQPHGPQSGFGAAAAEQPGHRSIIGSRDVKRLASVRFSTWLVSIILLLACSSPEGSAKASQASDTAKQDAEPQMLSSFDAELGMDERWTGDFDAMQERNVIRALVAYSKTFYFLDGATQRGATYEALKTFEDFVNQRLGRRTIKVHVVIIPVDRDQLLPALVQGLGDIAAANLTITPERLESIDFSDPLVSGVSEVVVTGPSAPQLASLDDLAGREIHIRRSSSYWQSLNELNGDLLRRGLDPIRLEAVQEYLEDEDLLEMVNAGVLEMIVVDSHKASFWDQIFDNIRVREDLAVRTGGKIGWAFRKESPRLAEVVNAFVKKHKKGTLLGNIILNRYLRDNPWVRNPLAEAERQRFESLIALFEKYGKQYDFDYLMLTALAYQESRLDQAVRSRAGAVGVMQLLPSTAADPNVGIPDISTVENNIHAGTKYLRFLRDRYFSDPALDAINQTLFTFAAYNAGPARVRRLRDEAAQSGLDPDQWFGNVEQVAARRIGRETVQYVSNIAKYYVAYSMAVRQITRKPPSVPR